MKILMSLLLISPQSFAQDKELFDFVNDYRIANGVKAVEWDEGLYEISKANTAEMVTNDSLMHSGTNTFECAVRDFTLTPTETSRVSFESFLSKYFDLDYPKPPCAEEDVIKFILLYVVYAWHSSPDHRKVMLADDVDGGSTSINIGDISLKKNYKTIGGKIVFLKKFITQYEVNHFATLNLSI